MISIRQIRAARALLNWKQKDIAEASGLSLTTLNYVEQETVSPRGNTMTAIQEAFEDAGVEFLSGDGVRMREEVFNVQTFEGYNSLRDMLDDAIRTEEKQRQGALWFGISEDFLVKNYRQIYFNHFIKMKALNLTERVITTEQQQHFYGPPGTTEYRILPHDLVKTIDYGIYGDKLCIATLNKKPRLVAIEHEGITNGFRLQFDAFWKMAKPARFKESGFERDYDKFMKLKNRKV